MKKIKVEIEIPDDAELVPALVVYFVRPPKELTTEFRWFGKDPLPSTNTVELCQAAMRCVQQALRGN